VPLICFVAQLPFLFKQEGIRAYSSGSGRGRLSERRRGEDARGAGKQASSTCLLVARLQDTNKANGLQTRLRKTRPLISIINSRRRSQLAGQMRGSLWPGAGACAYLFVFVSTTVCLFLSLSPSLGPEFDRSLAGVWAGDGAVV